MDVVQEKPGVFVGAKMTIADIHFFSVVEVLEAKVPNVLSAYPTLKKIYDGVHAHPKVAAYLKSRPTTPF